MASTLETLVIKLTADARLLEAELDKQVTKAERSGQRIESAFRSGLKFAGAIGIAATGLATGLTAAAQRAAVYADEIDQAAIKSRLARSTVQELRFATDQMGGSWTAVEANVRSFTTRMVQLERGNDAAAATFDRLGVSASDTNGKLRNTEDVFIDVLHQLAGIQNESERATRAVDLFGQSGTDLLPLLSRGATGIEELRGKAHELGLVLDDQSISTLVQYKTELSSVQQQVGALGRELTVALVPALTNTLLPALQTGLELLRAIPQPVKEFGIVTTTAAVGVSALAAALRLVGLSAAPLLGPAGLFLVAAAAVAYLGTKFVEADGPLKEHKAHIDELREAYEKYRGEINVTTDAEREGAVQRLQTLRAEMLERVRLLRQLADEQKQSVQGFLSSPIGRFLMPGFLNVEASAGYGTLTEIDKLEGTIASLGSDIRALQHGVTSFVPTSDDTPTPTPTATGVVKVAERTWQDVLADLDREGTEAMRRAAFEGTPEEFRKAAQKRVGLIDAAITEALSTFYGQVPAGDLAALRARRGAAAVQAREPVAAGAAPDPAARAALRAQADAIMADTLEAQRMAADADRAARVAGYREQLTINSDLRQQALAIMSDTSQAQADAKAAEEAQRAYIDSLADSGAELSRWLTTADSLTAALKAANDETARMGVFADALAKYGGGRAGLVGTSADRTNLPPLTNRGAAADLARDTVMAVTNAYHAGAASLDDVRTAVEAWTRITPQTVKSINDLTGGVLQLAIEAERAKNHAAALAEFESNPGLFGLSGLPRVKDFTGDKATRGALDGWRAPGDVTGGVRRSTVITWEEAQAALRAQEDAADRFASTVVSAGATFASDLVSAIRDGDVGAAFKSALGFGQSIAGAADLGALPFLGGNIGIGALLSVGLGLIGSLIGAITGGGSKASDATNDINRGSTPAINLNFTVNQSNTYNGSPSDPANEQAFARQAETLFEMIYRRHLEERFKRLEVRAGIA